MHRTICLSFSVRIRHRWILYIVHCSLINTGPIQPYLVHLENKDILFTFLARDNNDLAILVLQGVRYKSEES